MERKKEMLKTRYSKFLGAVMAVLLSVTPSIWAVDITVPILGPYTAVGEVNVYADITYGLFAMPGSTVNIYSGAIGDGVNFGITISTDEPLANVTVHGTGFAITNVSGTAAFDDPDNPTQIIPQPGWSGVLTGTYGDENGGGPINLLFWSDDPINLVNTSGPSTISVDIDIKPGSFPNAINLGSMGVVPVAILTTEEFNAATVNADTVLLAGSGVAVRGKADKLLASLEDVDGDGDIDLLLKVETENLDPDTFQNGSAILTGQTFDGTEITGSDSITIVPPEE